MGYSSRERWRSGLDFRELEILDIISFNGVLVVVRILTLVNMVHIQKQGLKEASKFVKEQESKAWYGYGMAPWNKKLDFFDTHYMISLMVLTLVLPVFIFSYRHDHLKRHWRRREAMLLIIEREKAGIPYVDRNYVDPAKLELPTDEELNGAEVII